MASYRKVGKNWFYRFVDADGVQRERKGCPGRRETEAMAAAAELEASKIRAGLIDPKALGFRGHEARPLAAHLADWHRDMVARGKTRKHADQYRERAGKLAAMLRGVRLADIDPGRKPEAAERAARALADALDASRLTDLAPDRIQAALARLRDAGKSLQTVNHYRAALRAFCRWAWETGRLRENPMKGVKGFNPEEDRRHERRTLTDEELARLVAAAETGPTLFGMSGPLRALAYRVAAATGFRAAELRTLTPESFRLDETEASVYLTASATKNRRPAEQPIPRALVPDLARWLAAVPAGASAFPLHHETAKAIRADLEAAGIPYATEEGVADFHSLRGYFVGALVKAGASISEVRTLARHAKPETTLKHYARVSAHDARRVVDALPVWATSPPRLEPLALPATGTDLQVISNPSSLLFPYAAQGNGCERVAADGSAVALGGKTETPEPLARKGSGRLLTGTGAERGGFEPPRPLSEPNGLANRESPRRNPKAFKPVNVLSASAHTFPSPTVAPDLAEIVAAWPTLPEAIRAGILAMVRAASTEVGR